MASTVRKMVIYKLGLQYAYFLSLMCERSKLNMSNDCFQHYLKVHAEKTFQCERCLKGFSTEAAKHRHIRMCGIKFTCSCNHAYESYEALLTHAKRFSHTFDEKFKLYGKYVLISNSIIS